MWHSSRTVRKIYATSDTKNAWADLDSLGWRRVGTGSSDGATNIHLALAKAQASGRLVDVYLDGDRITRVVLR